jgi:hypothetical protein
MVSDFFSANESEYTQLEEVYRSWTPSTSGSKSFDVTIRIRIVESELLIRPLAHEAVKFAWIQYLSIAFIFWVVLSVVRDCIFEYQFVPSRVEFEPWAAKALKKMK